MNAVPLWITLVHSVYSVVEKDSPQRAWRGRQATKKITTTEDTEYTESDGQKIFYIFSVCSVYSVVKKKNELCQK